MAIDFNALLDEAQTQQDAGYEMALTATFLGIPEEKRFAAHVRLRSPAQEGRPFGARPGTGGTVGAPDRSLTHRPDCSGPGPTSPPLPEAWHLGRPSQVAGPVAGRGPASDHIYTTPDGQIIASSANYEDNILLPTD